MKRLFAGVAAELSERVLSQAVADRVSAERDFGAQVQVLSALADVFSGDEESEARLVRLAEGVAVARATQLVDALEAGKFSSTEVAGEVVRSFTELSILLPEKLSHCGATLRTAVQRQFRLRCATSDGVLDALYVAFFELQEADLQAALTRARFGELEPRLREVLSVFGLGGERGAPGAGEAGEVGEKPKAAKSDKKHQQ